MLGANLEDAVDVAQETCVEVWTSWNAIDSPRAWSRVVAKRLLYKLRRENNRKGFVPGDESDLAAESALNLKAESQHVIAFLRSLPSAQREVAALHYDGFSNAEIAGLLGKNPATVASLLRHAKCRLRDVLLSNEGDEQSEP